MLKTNFLHNITGILFELFSLRTPSRLEDTAAIVNSSVDGEDKASATGIAIGAVAAAADIDNQASVDGSQCTQKAGKAAMNTETNKDDVKEVKNSSVCIVFRYN